MATLLRDAETFLVRADETGKLAGLVDKHRCGIFSPEGLGEVVDPFTALASGIIGQQVRFKFPDCVGGKGVWRCEHAWIETMENVNLEIVSMATN